MATNIYPKILLMIACLYMIRLTPFLFLRKKIENSFVRSFLFYVPYVTLAVMTFPAIITATDNIYTGIAAFVTGIVVAWFGGNLIVVASCCCVAVLLSGMII